MPYRFFSLPFLRRTNLWLRLAVAATGGFLVLFVVVDLLILRVADDSRDRILQGRLVVAELAARQVDGVLQHDFAELQAAAASKDVQRLDPASSDMSAALQGVIDNTGEKWLALYLADPDGALLAAAPASRNTGSLNPIIEPAVKQAATEGSANASAPFQDSVFGGSPAAALAVPFRQPSGRPLVLAGEIDVSRSGLAGVLADARGIGETGHAELFDSAGRVIASTDAVNFLAPGEHIHFYLTELRKGTPDVETVPLEPRDQSEAKSESGEHIMAVGLLKSAPWGVAVGGSKAETLAPLTDLRNEMVLLGAVTLIVLWLITLAGARILTRPVHLLTGAADRIAAGDLETPIRVTEGGEIGKLGETLETMRGKLKASVEELAERDRYLERRVEERTAQVQALLEELQAKEEVRTRLLDSVINAQEEERKRIARELHDETGQALTGIIMSLEAAQEALSREPEAARERLQKAGNLASQSIDGIRHLVVGLRPAALDDLGLVPALRAYVESRLGEKGIELEMEAIGLRERLSPSVETCLFRVVQEAVTNIIRHSEATHAQIRLRRANGAVSLVVADNGKGFDPGGLAGSPDRAAALGLAGMEERMSLIGGYLAIDSAPGRGTRVSATVELEKGAQA